MGDPAQVRAGIYARQALQNGGVWDQVKGKLAPALNVRGALRLVLSGAAPLGVVYETDTVGVDVIVQLEIANDLHQPIAYVMSRAPNAGADTLAFFTYLQQNAAKETAFEYGYLALEED
jgi:molybdate transport system substrate-binding protein